MTPERLPEPPLLRRRIGAPKRLVAGMVVVLTLPVLATSGLLGHGAFERVLRVAAVFCVLLLVFRVIGKRELSRLSPFELVTLMMVPEVVSNAVQNQGSLLEALAGLSTLFFLVLLSSVLAHRFETVEKLVEPRSTLLIDQGTIIEHALNEERIVADELYSEMRKNGISDASQVRWAVLESSGNITFVPKANSGSAGDDDAGPSS